MVRKPLARAAMRAALEQWAAELKKVPLFEGEALIRDEAKFDAELALVLAHVDKGCLEDIEGMNYYRILHETETGRITLRCLRGSNGNESSHTVIHSIVKQNSNVATAGLNTSLGMNRLNLQAGVLAGDYTDLGHSMWWEATDLNTIWKKLYHKRLLLLPPSNLKMPFSYEHCSPLSSSCGVSAGKYHLASMYFACS